MTTAPHQTPSTAPSRPARSPAELRALAAACRKEAADTRRALPKTRERDQDLMRARIYRLERLASEMERAAQRAEDQAA